MHRYIVFLYVSVRLQFVAMGSDVNTTITRTKTIVNAASVVSSSTSIVIAGHNFSYSLCSSFRVKRFSVVYVDTSTTKLSSRILVQDSSVSNRSTLWVTR